MGPACNDAAILTKMFDAGLDIARLDLSTGDYETLEGYLANIEKVQKVRMGKAIAIMVDLVGPIVKIGTMKDNEPVSLAAG